MPVGSVVLSHDGSGRLLEAGVLVRALVVLLIGSHWSSVLPGEIMNSIQVQGSPSLPLTKLPIKVLYG